MYFVLFCISEAKKDTLAIPAAGTIEGDKKLPAKPEKTKLEPKEKQKPAPATTVSSKMSAPSNPNSVMDFVPIHIMHQYSAYKHDRIGILFEAPASFDGSEGSYRCGCFDPMWLTFAVPINNCFIDPDILHGWLQVRYGRIFAADSEKEKSWRQTVKTYANKEATFNLKLPFACQEEPADDIGHDGLIFLEPEVSGKPIPLIYIELKSIHRNEAVKKTSKSLQKQSFQSPDKVAGASVKGPIASKAQLLELAMQLMNDMGHTESGKKKRGADDEENEEDAEGDTQMVDNESIAKVLGLLVNKKPKESNDTNEEY